ncbi:hypothetical protein [Mycoplasma sp. Ms02]|uniref:hypothetical protein n=1 Tax=Mycoplasma sp. Ms02 TaxID=353851 RepID=UPI001C8A71F3|nr:hypothetical protein [Mycoplasma sp. Ms02]QZE12460.1 hypothetical protein K4L35_00500 [Mycoplasma sp. Ms02]
MTIPFLITFTVLFGLLSIVLFSFYPISIRKIREFKKLQFEEYKKNNPRTKFTRYEQTGLFLPSWERAKYNSPLIFGLASLIIAVSLFVALIAAL